MTPHNFAKFIGYEDETYDEFMESVNLAKIAVYYETSRAILNEKSFEAIEFIKDKKNNMDHSTPEFDTQF